MKTIQIFNKACKQILVVLLLSIITFTVNAQVCTSTKDYETGLKNGLKMAPPCELTNTSKLQKCVGDYSPTTWSTCYGERTAANGGTYRGGYLEGKAHGKGEFVNPDGSRYLGDYVKGQRNGYGKEYSATGAIVKAGEWHNGVFAASTPQGQDKTANSNQNQNSTPLRGFNDALKASLDIAEKNPKFLNYIISTASSNDIAMCAAIGMKATAFSAVNPEALDGPVAKVHALNAAGMGKSYQYLVDKGTIPKGTLMTYVNIFNPLSLGDILEKNWSTCDRVLAAAMKLVDQNELTTFLRRPYVK